MSKYQVAFDNEPAIIQEKNKAYIDGFGYVAPSKTKTIIVDSDGDMNKIERG